MFRTYQVENVSNDSFFHRCGLWDTYAIRLKLSSLDVSGLVPSEYARLLLRGRRRRHRVGIRTSLIEMRAIGHQVEITAEMITAEDKATDTRIDIVYGGVYYPNLDERRKVFWFDSLLMHQRTVF